LILIYVAETAMGLSVHAQTSGQVDYIKAVKRSEIHTELFLKFLITYKPSDNFFLCYSKRFEDY